MPSPRAGSASSACSTTATRPARRMSSPATRRWAVSTISWNMPAAPSSISSSSPCRSRPSGASCRCWRSSGCLSAHSSKLRLRPRSYSYIGSVPVLDVSDKPIADWDLVLKGLFDRVVGALLLVLLSPILIATAAAVKLDSRGPVFFRQKRYGFNNELIEVFKFRSMRVDQCDTTASKLVTRHDPRVTRVGRFIRKASIDELPQLFNVVLKGNLSLVGPRPHALHAKAENRLYDQVVDGYFARHKVRPGLTGWAQINGWRGETDTSEKIQRRVEHDLYYIENWSVFFDLYILALTPFALLKSENAY